MAFSSFESDDTDVMNEINMTPLVDVMLVLLIVFIIGITSWMHTARIVRGDVLALKEREFVLAAKSVGTPSRSSAATVRNASRRKTRARGRLMFALPRQGGSNNHQHAGNARPVNTLTDRGHRRRPQQHRNPILRLPHPGGMSITEILPRSPLRRDQRSRWRQVRPQGPTIASGRCLRRLELWIVRVPHVAPREALTH